MGSKQRQEIPMSLWGKAVVLMGKNTMMHKAIRGTWKQPSITGETVAPHPGDRGFVFTSEDLPEIRDMLLASKVPAVTCAGVKAAWSRCAGPEHSSGAQLDLLLPGFRHHHTKISRGTIEILSDVQLIKTRDKVGSSEATLLNMLNISPSPSGWSSSRCLSNGSIYNPCSAWHHRGNSALRFLEGVHNVPSVCLQIGYPTVAICTPFYIISGYKWVLALSVETDYTFPLAEKVKAFLADLFAFVTAATTAAPPQARLKQRKSRMESERIWDSVSLTNHQKAANLASIICEMRLKNKALLILK